MVWVTPMKNEVTAEELRQYKLFIGTPCYGGQTTGVFCQSLANLVKLCTLNGIGIEYFFLFNESLVQRARNYIVDEFLRSDATHLVFIDADIGFKPEDVLSLLAVQTSAPEKYDIVAGPYAKKVIDWNMVEQAVTNKACDSASSLQHFAGDFVFNARPDQSHMSINEPVEVYETGTGFMLIPREVFVKYDKAYPEYRYLPDHTRSKDFNGAREITAFFDCSIDPNTRRYLSEDYHFCRKAGEIGISIWLCPWMQMTHVGSYGYKGSMAAKAVLMKKVDDNRNNSQHDEAL